MSEREFESSIIFRGGYEEGTKEWLREGTGDDMEGIGLVIKKEGRAGVDPSNLFID